jgi:Zn-dependent alcohol dehydrogenase
MVTVGVLTPDTVADAIRAVRKDGIVVVTAVGKHEEALVPINLLDLTMEQKKLKGALFGQASPFASIPLLARMYARGQLKLDEVITKALQR